MAKEPKNNKRTKRSNQAQGAPKLRPASVRNTTDERCHSYPDCAYQTEKSGRLGTVLIWRGFQKEDQGYPERIQCTEQHSAYDRKVAQYRFVSDDFEDRA